MFNQYVYMCKIFKINVRAKCIIGKERVNVFLKF